MNLGSRSLGRITVFCPPSLHLPDNNCADPPKRDSPDRVQQLQHPARLRESWDGLGSKQADTLIRRAADRTKGRICEVTALDWLLDADPAVRWQAMRDLTDAPAALNTKRPPGPGGLFQSNSLRGYLFAAAIRSAFSYISASIGLMSSK